MHRATCSRFETIPACDRQTDGQQTDGIAVASTALAMPAVRRAVMIYKITTVTLTYSKSRRRHVSESLNATWGLFVERTPQSNYFYEKASIR